MAEQNNKIERKAPGRVKSRLLRVLAIILILLLALPVLIHFGPIQKFIISRVTNSISQKTGSKVDIDKVNFSLLKGLVLKDIYISETTNPLDTLAFVGELSSSLEENLLSLIKNKVSLEDLNLFEARIKLKRKQGSKLNNLDDFLLKLSSDKEKKNNSSAKPLDLSLKNINLRNLDFSTEDEGKQSSFFAKLKEGHIGIKELYLEKDSFILSSISLLRPEIIIAEVVQKPSNTEKVKAVKQPKDSTANEVFLSVGILEITEGNFQRLKSDSLVNTASKNTLDVNDLNVSKLDMVCLNLVVNDFKDIEAKVESLSLEEHNGLILEKLSIDSFSMHPDRIRLKDFYLQTDNSRINDYLEFRFESLSDFSHFAQKVNIISDMTGSEIALRDLGYFIPDLAESGFMENNRNRKLSMTGAFKGTVDDLEAKNLYLTIDNLVEFSGEFSSSNLTNSDKALVSLYVSDLRTSLYNIRRILPGFKLPAQFYKLDPINFTGDIEGFFKDFVIYGKLKSRLGDVVLDTRLNSKNGLRMAEYSGILGLRNFNLKEWTGNDDFGFATFEAEIQDGQGLTLETVKTDLTARLDSFEFKNYNYTNVNLEGTLEKSLFDGIFSVRDPNVDLDFEGQIILEDNYFNSDFEAVITKINPSALNLGEDYTSVTGDFNLKLEGKTLNEFAGSAEFNNFKLIFRDKEFDFDELYFSSAPSENGKRNLLLTSDILNASVDGTFDFAELVPAFNNYIIQHHPKWARQLKLIPSGKTLKNKQNFGFKFEIFDTKDYLELAKLNDLRFRGVTFQGKINLMENKFNGNISVDSSFYKDYTFTAFGLALTNNKQVSKLILDLEKIVTADKYYEPLSIRSLLNGDDVILEIETKNVLDSIGYIDLTLNITPVDDKIKLNIGNKNLQMFSSDWEIDESNEIIYGKNYISIKDFVLSDGYRNILIQDYKKGGLEFNLENFNFLLINGIINYDKIEFAGEGNIYARVANIFKKPSVVADVRIPEFTLNNIDYGALALRLDDDGNKSYASLNINRVEDEMRILMNAEYDKKTSNVNGNITMRNMVMNTFEFIIDDGISDTDGVANIDVDIFGKADDIQLEGTARVTNGQTRIDYLGALIGLGEETFTITEDFIDLTGVSLFDKFGNQATMTGGLHHKLFGDFRTELNMQSTRFLALDTEKSDNSLYYGTGIGDLSIDFFGPFSSTDITINAITGQGTVLNIPVEDSYYDVDENFIKFVPRDEILAPQKADDLIEALKLEGVDVEMNLTITEDAQVNIIFDERLNDIIKGVGDGDLRITIARDGKFNIYGEYVVRRGEYLFTAWGVVAKPFKVREGGVITWTGDPVNANLNIEADYDDLRAPVNVLLAEYLVASDTRLEREARERTRIDLTVNLGGTLYDPIVNFDIDFPELQGELRTYADSKMITLRENEADLNEQVAGLIMFRSFLPSSSLGSVFTNSNSFVETTYNTLSEFLSNQLSYLLSGFLQEALTENGFISGIDFEIGFSKNANLLEGAPQSDNYFPDEIEVHFKPRFQNDKWGIDYGTSFVNSDGSSASDVTNYIIHDFVLEYYLTADRKLKLRAYGKWDRRPYTQVDEQRYGLGINYRKEFGTIADFQKSLNSDIGKLKSTDDTSPNE